MSRSTYYTARARTPKNCWTCDSLTGNCRCSKEEIRAAKRGAKVHWDKEIANDVEDYQEELNEIPDYCGEDCSYCGSSNLDNWLAWLRSQESYPPKVLSNPVLSKENLAA